MTVYGENCDSTVELNVEIIDNVAGRIVRR